MDQKAPDKKQRLLAALDKGLVMIHLDARRPGVRVPSHLGQEAHLRLNLSYRFDPPDLTVGEWGIRSTLSFSGSRFTVAIPWSALFAITSHLTKEFWLYPDDMPPELLQQAATAATADVPPSAPPAEASAGPKLVVHQAPPTEAAAPSEPEPPSEEPPKPRGRGHLRVVK